MTELHLMNAFLFASAEAFGDRARAFRRNIVNLDVQKNGRTFHAKAGIRGQCDVYVLVRGGRHLELEMKAARGRLFEEQRAWEAWCRSMAIPYLQLRALSNEHPSATVERWIQMVLSVIA